MKDYTLLIVLVALAVIIIGSLLYLYLTQKKDSYDSEQEVTVSLNTEDLSKITGNGWTKADVMINGTTYSGKLKVRGFSSGFQSKKPYNIKFNKPITIPGLGTSDEWALIGEFYDMTFILNQLTYSLGTSMGIPSPPWKNVIFNTTENGIKTYHGLYSLSKKFTYSDVDSNVDVIIEFDRPDPAKNLITPADPFCNSAPIIFDYDSSKYTVDQIKSKYAPIYLSIKDMNVSQLSTVLDYDSFVNYFIISELADSVDGYLVSTYTYVKDNKIHMGFLWDYNMAFGNYIDTVDPKTVESLFWSCRSPQLFNKWRYYESNRFAMSSTKYDPTNLSNYNNSSSPDEYMINLRGLPGPDGKPSKDPNNFTSFSRNCTEGNVVTNWYVKLMSDPVFKNKVNTRYQELRKTILSTSNILKLIEQFSSPLKSLDMAPKDIQTWFDVNSTPNITNVSNPKKDSESALDFYNQTVEYLKKWVQNRILWLDSEIQTQNFPNTLDNINKWQNYQTECNLLPQFK
jgi:hypothetical protein